MGRYDRDSVRYSRLKDRYHEGVPFAVIVFLMVVSGLLGFLVRPYVESFAQPVQRLLAAVIAGDASSSSSPSVKSDITPSSTSVSESGATESLEQIKPPSAPIILPTLDSSDAEVRHHLINAAPELVAWLAADDLIRKFIAITNDFSQGQRINKHLDFMRLPKSLAVKGDLKLIIAPESYHRYDSLALAIDHLDVVALVDVYVIFKPLLLQAYDELGLPDENTLDAMLIRAGGAIVSAPLIEADISVIKHSLMYQFADPQLEAMSPLHKQMLRMGSNNTRLIQNKVKLFIEKMPNPR